MPYFTKMGSHTISHFAKPMLPVTLKAYHTTSKQPVHIYRYAQNKDPHVAILYRNVEAPQREAVLIPRLETFNWIRAQTIRPFYATYIAKNIQKETHLPSMATQRRKTFPI